MSEASATPKLQGRSKSADQLRIPNKQQVRARSQQERPMNSKRLSSRARELSCPILLGDDFDTAEILASLDEGHRPLFKALNQDADNSLQEDIRHLSKREASRSVSPWQMAAAKGTVTVTLGRVSFGGVE